ncbi:MAG: methionine adenosyltransferase [Bifidobacteriaceae bacterium]|jgi:S-adenosylmethionine synthetase|nr:methionine adenosyltransferase [Bifidobacteriaceae bacterium]MCI1978857.1 methionine adenosyltransferase [Bifidobacteriaceae bacterium]
MTEPRLMTAESVTEGHPDKICDQISDAILDDLLIKDPHSRVAVETSATKGQFFVFGEVTSEGYTEIPKIVRDVVRGIGYTSSDIGLDADSCGVLVAIGQQSTEISQGVDRLGRGHHLTAAERESLYESQGAGDQGVMFGYACDETDVLMPLPITIAHRLSERLADVRKKAIVPHLRPDGKTQVTVEYDEDGRPLRINTIVVSTQHDPDVAQEYLRAQLLEHVITPVLDSVCGAAVEHDHFRLFVNPTGSFVLGGPAADAGLTGRKIIVDTYGGAAHHGGGAFSGKDPSKVDRSAAYAARWVAKNIVAAGLAHRVEVQIAYAIGIAEPVAIMVDTFGTEQGATRAQIEAAVRETFDLRPAAIIDALDLIRPIYAKTAAYGHFGRTDPDFTWERTDRAEALKSAVAAAENGNE